MAKLMSIDNGGTLADICLVDGASDHRVKTETVLEQENRTFEGTGGVSARNRGHGFRPAFLDADTGEVYASCYASGQPAGFHLLDGLPDALIVSRHADGRVATVKQSIVSGFVLGGHFYTRDQAAAVVATRH